MCMEDVGLGFLLKILTSMSEVIGGSPSVCWSPRLFKSTAQCVPSHGTPKMLVLSQRWARHGC